MQPTGGTNHSSGALPPRQTWYPAHRRAFASLYIAVAALMLIAIAILWFPAGERGRWDLALTLILAVQIVAFPVLAWTHTRARLEADAEGLHLVQPLGRTTYRWDDIAEIRPSILKGKKTYLVLVRRNKEIIDLPVTEEHLDTLRRWHQAAT
jgi:hypothetical protein